MPSVPFPALSQPVPSPPAAARRAAIPTMVRAGGSRSRLIRIAEPHRVARAGDGAAPARANQAAYSGSGVDPGSGHMPGTAGGGGVAGDVGGGGVLGPVVTIGSAALGASRPVKAAIRSIGRGKITVELFSEAISTKVCR